MSMKAVKHGWSKRERELVRLWVAQISINRHRHQLASDSYSTLSFRLQLIGIIITTTGAVFSFMSSYFNNDPEVVRVLTIIAGILALISALFAGIFATVSPDTNSEKHRQTGIHYANYSNEIQAVLVEENDEHLPHASEFLARIRNGIHLLQSFGPSLDETADSDLPSSFLLRDFDGTYKNSTAPSSKALVPGSTLASLPTGYDMFKREDEPEATATARAERRRAALEQLRKDREEIAARKQQIIEEEQDLQNIMQENATLKSKSSGALAAAASPVAVTSTPNLTTHVAASAHTPAASAPSLHDSIKPKSDQTAPIRPILARPIQLDNIVSDSESGIEEDHLAHGSDVDTHHTSAVAVLRGAINASYDEQARKVRTELRQRYKSLQLAKEQLVDSMIACETRTSELESEERVVPKTPSPPPAQTNIGTVVIDKIKSVLKKSLSPVPTTEQEVIDMQTQKVKELGFSPEELV